ncbi:hypothetical protein EV696_103307 [Permianibacter aggregans]|uniref:Uncharacterized protein n=1 Tax=Permianibacter aggregans TaxID=1510150 RepID=A0A4R6US88_9GAMM|nr:hypothetical protein EV696_103307 [Permianibacter aggregans]
MVGRFEKVDKAYVFLAEKERSKSSFTTAELSEATGWAISSCRTYLCKRWHQHLERDRESYKPIGIRALSKEKFRALHSQKLQRVEDRSEVGILLTKAKCCVSLCHRSFCHSSGRRILRFYDRFAAFSS